MTGTLVRTTLLTAWKCVADWRVWAVVVVSACASIALAVAGVDAWVNRVARLQPEERSILWSAFPLLAGFGAPAIVPLLYARWRSPTIGAQSLGAAIAASIIVLMCKAVTSRVSPEALFPASLFERSVTLRLGLLEAGVIESLVEGWPSGHAASNTAFCAILIRSSFSRPVRVAAAVWMTWVAAATILGISGDVHWVSDSLTGVALGACVALIASGRTVEPPARSGP